MSNVTIVGLAPLLAKLQRFPQIAEPELKRASDRTLLAAVAWIKVYPPQSSATSYRRTNTLGRFWTSAQPSWQANAGGYAGRIGNPVQYAPYVQGQGLQARVHQGRWRTDEQAAERVRPIAQSEVLSAVQRIADVIGR